MGNGSFSCEIKSCSVGKCNFKILRNNNFEKNKKINISFHQKTVVVKLSSLLNDNWKCLPINLLL